MLLHSHDEQILNAGSNVAKTLGQIELTSTLQKADAMFQSIMDPRNEDTRRLIAELFYAPMKSITDKALAAVDAISVEEPALASQQIQLARDIMELSREVRDVALETVYDNMQRQIDHFSTCVRVYNEMMKETVLQALNLYKARIDTEIDVRSKVLQQKKDEHDFMLKAANAENEAMVQNMLRTSHTETEISEQRLEQKKKHDERAHQKETKVLQREEKKIQDELERQRKRDELHHKKMEQDLERQAKKDLADHDKVLKELEAKTKRGQIDREARNGLVEELKVEMSRYNTDFALAQEAMRNAIAKNRTCRIENTAPKIDWGRPPEVPPRVILGSISWSSQG
jgi:chromosome segregation ATPase